MNYSLSCRSDKEQASGSPNATHIHTHEFYSIFITTSTPDET